MSTYLTGANGAAEAIKRGRGVLYVARTSGRCASLIELAGQNHVDVRRVSESELDRLVSRGDHRGFSLEIPSAQTRAQTLNDLWNTVSGQDSLVVVLDGVTDPRNLGAVLRSADQFEADAVVVPRRRSAGKDADSISRTSSGAMEWVPLIEVANLARTLGEFKNRGYWIWGADMAGDDLPRVDLKGKTCLVMGREGEGLHRLVKEQCDGLLQIPTGGRIDSLNVATAAGILMYEVRRQQEFPFRSPVS
jgi:23S rRNA (guanosine2251-2'-O)-methyltransferase